MPAASPAPPQTSLPDASSSLFGLLFEAELPEGEEARSGMQGAGDGDSEGNERQVLPWWPILTVVGAAQSMTQEISQTAPAAGDEAKLGQPSAEIRAVETAVVEPAKSSPAPSEPWAAETPQIESSAKRASLAPPQALVPAAGLGFGPGQPSPTDDSPLRTASKAAQGKPEAGRPELINPAAAQAGGARRGDAGPAPAPERTLVGRHGQAQEGGQADPPLSNFSVAARDLAVGNKLGLPLPEARGGEAEAPARNGPPHSPSPQEAARTIGLAPGLFMQNEDGLQTGTFSALRTAAGVENDPPDAGGWVRPDPAISVLRRGAAREAHIAAAGQTEEGLTNSKRLTNSKDPEPTAQPAAGGAALPALPLEAPGARQAAGEDRLGGAVAAAPQPTRAPVVADPPRRFSTAAGESERQATQEPEQPLPRPNQAPVETLAQAAAVVLGIQTGTVSSRAAVRSGPVRPDIAPRPNSNPKGSGSSTTTAAEGWSGLPERDAGAPLWSSEVAFAARLAESAESATLNSDARSMGMPGARQAIEPGAQQGLPGVTAGAPGRGVESSDRAQMNAHKTGQEPGRVQARELLGNDGRTKPPAETAAEARSGLAEESAPAPRRPVAHAGAAFEVQPQAATSRLAAEWSASSAAHRQDPAAGSGQAAPGTPAKGLREAVAGADPAERPVQAQPGGTVRELKVRVAEAGVEVRLSPAARELHVAVRTPQPELREALRSGLDELASRLAERGLEAQIWRPGSSSGPGGTAERGWEAVRAQFADGGEPGADRRGQPDQQPPGDQQRRPPDPRWDEAWSELEGEASPPVWRLRR